MDQTEELIQLRAELAALKLSISKKNPNLDHNSEPASISKAASIPESTPATQPALLTSAPAPGNIHGSRYAVSATTTATSPGHTLPGQGIARRGHVSSTENSSQEPAAPTSTAIPAHCNGNSSGGNAANRGPLTPRDYAQQINKSLLGQDYQPPTKEKVAKRGAVKMVSANDPSVFSQATGQNVILDDATMKTERRAPRQELEEEAARKAEKQDFKRQGAIKAEEDNLRRAEPRGLAAQDDRAHGIIGNTATTADSSNEVTQRCENGVAEKSFSKANTPDAERNDFTVNYGRRICVSNLPSGATEKDIQELVEKKANAGQLIETIEIYRRPNRQPGYALVDVLNSHGASHIVKWMTDERLFGWPIDLRMAHELSKEAIDNPSKDGSAAFVFAKEESSARGAVGRDTCRYLLSGYCRDGVNCRFVHDTAGSGSPAGVASFRGHPNARRDGLQRGRRNYNFDNMPLPAKDDDDGTGDSIFGTSVYRPTVLRIVDDGL